MKSSFAETQIKRLSGLDFYPTQPEGVRELVRSLAKYAKSEPHATAIIDWWLERNAKCPKPSDFKLAAGEVPQVTGTPLPAACERCAGGDWLHKTIRRMSKLTGQEEDVSAMCRCSCDRGRQLAKRDEQHQAETAKPVKQALVSAGDLL